jgi:hypothetical protein
MRAAAVALPTGVLAALAIGHALALPASAQEIAGVAVDSVGRPLTGVPVALHRVGGGTVGGSVAAVTTDDAGRFRFQIQAVDSAVYFVAMRHAGLMYIGPMARGGIQRVTDYVLRAAPETEAGAVASALSGAPAAPMSPPVGPPEPLGRADGGAGPGAVWLVAVLALVFAGTFLATAPGYRARRRRALVMELARLENRLAADPGSEAEAERRRRDALRERLAPPA